MIPKISTYSHDISEVGKRDAFHVPGVLVTSECVVQGCENVRFTDTTLGKVVPTSDMQRHAIVDPFVTIVPQGSSFWVFLLPDTVRSLVHSFDVDLSGLQAKPPEEAPEDEQDDEEDYDDGCKGCYE